MPSLFSNVTGQALQNAMSKIPQKPQQHLLGGPQSTTGSMTKSPLGHGGAGTLSPAAAGIGGIIGQLIGGGGNPYEHAQSELEKYYKQAQGYQNPFYEAGTGTLPYMERYIGEMADPAKFIGGLESQYQESPEAKQAQQEALKGGQSAAAASGMLGSTPFMKQQQQTASDVANRYKQQWLKNVLGIHGQYGQGLSGLTGMGQHAADEMTGMSEREAQAMADMAYGQSQAQNKQAGGIGGLIGGLTGLVGGLI